MNLVNILRIITFSFLVGHSILTISDFNSFRVFSDTLYNAILTNIFYIGIHIFSLFIHIWHEEHIIQQLKAYRPDLSEYEKIPLIRGVIQTQ
jgi:hypothetical protein